MTDPFKTAEEFYKVQQDLAERFHAMKPELEISVRDPEMGVEGYAVVWNTKIAHGGPFDNKGRGMGKGGTRTIPGVTLDDVKMLARGMAEKNAAAGLPMGGSKSGARLDNKDPDYEKKYRRFIRLLKDTGVFYEDGGTFGGLGYDVGCIPPKNAIWAVEELGTQTCHTGKPLDLGGTDYDREGLAGLGVAVAGRVLTQSRHIENPGYAVQGAGAMGAAVIRYFEGTLKAVSDPKYGGTWTLENPSKDLIFALSHQDTDTAKTLLAVEGKNISASSDDVLYQDVDILFPCALQDVITGENASRIRAPLMCEGANHPTTDEAHEILHKNGVVTVPDIIANVGGIVAAYVELTSDAKGEAKVQAARNFILAKVAENAAELIRIVDTYKVQPDRVGDYMAHRNIFYGLDNRKTLIL